jgi:hypothetical protein
MRDYMPFPSVAPDAEPSCQSLHATRKGAVRLTAQICDKVAA